MPVFFGKKCKKLAEIDKILAFERSLPSSRQKVLKIFRPYNFKSVPEVGTEAYPHY